MCQTPAPAFTRNIPLARRACVHAMWDLTPTSTRREWMRTDFGVLHRVGGRGGSLMRAVFAVGATLLLLACRPPVGVSRVSPRIVTQELTRSALNSTSPSAFSQNVLHPRNVSERFQTDPEGALEALHQLVVQGQGRHNTLVALAELSSRHADRTRKKSYYLESAVCAWAFLFPGEDEERPDEFDPRLRIASDLYNRALTRGLSSADDSVVDLRSGLYLSPSGTRSRCTSSRTRCVGPAASWSISCLRPSSG